MEEGSSTRRIRSSQQASKTTESDTKSLLHQIDPTNFCERIKTEKEAVEFACEFNLLPRRNDAVEVKCGCGFSFGVKGASRTLCGWVWDCKNCGKSLSPTTGTIFQNSSMSVRDILKMILCFVSKLDRQTMVAFLKVDEKTVTQWCRKFRKAMEIVNSNDFSKLDDKIEIDESCLCRNKYACGSLLSVQRRHLWILGFIERGTKKRFMTRIYRRTIPTIPTWLEYMLQGDQKK